MTYRELQAELAKISELDLDKDISLWYGDFSKFYTIDVISNNNLDVSWLPKISLEHLLFIPSSCK